MKTITETAATSIGHAIARDWAGLRYNAADLAIGTLVASRGKAVIPAPRKAVFGKKRSA